MPAAEDIAILAMNRSHPTASKLKLGTALAATLNKLNTLIIAHNDLVTKHNALLARLDTANVAGIGNTNVATFSPTTTTVPAATTFGSY